MSFSITMTDKLILIYSKVGWEKLNSLIGSWLFSDKQRKHILDNINDNDCHQVDANGAHLLYWSACDTSCNDMITLITHLTGAIPSVEWVVHIISNNGIEDKFGRYINNPFAPNVERTFSWSDNNATLVKDRVSVDGEPGPQPVVTAAVNNHKCGACGNDRCSTTEVTCWKCGNKLKP